MPIRVLPPEVASRIAAGEVVERPASAVKELVENSLDAGADEIRVEVREGGRRLVRVVDNGAGIPAGEAALAFERHATSKLRSADDLESVTTLGFRGEALASIASVAQVTLLTRHVDEAVGSQLRVEGGHLVGQEAKGAPPGAVVTVENLFYNVPARLKFLRQPATESGHIADVVQRFAMAFPERRFSLVSDGRLVFQSTGSGRLHDVLVKVWGLDVGRQLVPVGMVEGDDSPGRSGLMDSARVAGYVGLPTLSRSNRNHILFFLNRRSIQDRSLAYAVTEAYRNRLMVGRYPVSVLMIDLDPALVDVNVHPAKAEVRFREERAVFRAVQKAVHAALAEHAPVPEVRSEGLSWTMPGWAERREALLAAGQNWQPSLALPRDEPTVTRQQWPAADASAQQASWRNEPATDSVQLTPDFTPTDTDSVDSETNLPIDQSTSSFPILRVVGQMGATYIVAEGPEGMYLVDQHAAHERILFEQMLGQQAAGGVAQQALLEPLAFEAGSSYAGLLAEYGDALAAAGFSVEPFGSETWLVRAVPAVYSRVDPRRALEETLEGVADGRDLVGESKEAALVAVICKRAAIKGGQALSLDEMRQLVRQLEACRDPGSCPHGRPTMLVLSRLQLEKEFGRRG